MTVPEQGRAWVFGDRIDTDVLAPGSLMKLDATALAAYCLKSVRPEFAAEVRPGDFLVAGESFGIGSSREQAAVSLKVLGVSAVLAVSFARIFYRNAYNQGLPALPFPQARMISDGDRLLIDLAKGVAVNHTKGQEHRFPAIPNHLMDIISAGGLTPYLKRRLAKADSGA
jgi:3-isopropylmalate/(R)-2-methylmalate dehydratase small subunit